MTKDAPPPSEPSQPKPLPTSPTAAASLDTVTEVMDFYRVRLKPLLFVVEALNRYPQEVAFEVKSAFEHLSRMYLKQNAETEEEACNRAYAHLKRALLDLYKIFLVETNKQYDVVQHLDMKPVDGEFDKRLRRLMTAIRQGAMRARQAESNWTSDNVHEAPAYAEWDHVFVGCSVLHTHFFPSEVIVEARKHGRRRWFRDNILWPAIICTIVGACFFGLGLMVGGGHP